MTPRTFFHKIIKDLLISAIITFFLMLIPELILPGIVSSHFSPKYLLAAILILGWLFAWQAKESRPVESSKFKAISQNILNIILFIITILLILSLYKMKIWQIIIAAVFSVFLLITAKYTFIEEERKQ
ncbi:MAG: hypothetical protein QMD77_01350 [Patescibacteria group bacterium]|nr:hypothetical protein [Patescibacteria group bacterium]